jgi:hypothetical protein
LVGASYCLAGCGAFQDASGRRERIDSPNTNQIEKWIYKKQKNSEMAESWKFSH